MENESTVVDIRKSFNGLERDTEHISSYTRTQSVTVTQKDGGVEIYIGPKPDGSIFVFGNASIVITKDEAKHIASVLAAAAG